MPAALRPPTAPPASQTLRIPCRCASGRRSLRAPERAGHRLLRRNQARADRANWIGGGLAAEDRTDRFVPTRLGRAKTSFDPMIWLARPERQAPPSPAS